MKISVITPSVRLDGLEIVRKSLRRQDFEDFEWIVTSPFEYKDCDLWLPDPPKREGDFWNLCKAWNNAYAHAQGELIVNVQDHIWLPPDSLTRFWLHYENDPKALVSAVGNHYSQLDSRGVPENLVWQDPRMESDKSFEKSEPPKMEMSVCSVPKKAIIECGGIDEEYDKGPGVQEKEMCFRLMMLGWQMYIDRGIEYRAIAHGRLTEDWDEKYFGVIAPMFTKHMHDLLNGGRKLNIGCLERYNKDV